MNEELQVILIRGLASTAALYLPYDRATRVATCNRRHTGRQHFTRYTKREREIYGYVDRPRLLELKSALQLIHYTLTKTEIEMEQKLARALFTTIHARA